MFDTVVDIVDNFKIFLISVNNLYPYSGIFR
jgi:hypothetical protein